METAEGIEGGVVATEVRRILFIALALVDIVVGVEMMGDEFLEGTGSVTGWVHGDIVEHLIQQIIKDLTDLFGDDGDLDLGHVFK
jgi:hypothetical protein